MLNLKNLNVELLEDNVVVDRVVELFLREGSRMLNDKDRNATYSNHCCQQC